MRPALLALTLAGSPAPVDVEWHGDPTCPSPHDFNHDLEVHLRGGAYETTVHALVDVAQIGESWTLTLTLTTPDGASTRELTGASCTAVSTAAAFITALVVDPALLSRPPDQVPEPPPPAAQPEPPPQPRPQQAPPPPLTPLRRPPPPLEPAPERRDIRGFVRLAGGLEAFGMPGVGPTLLPALGVIGRRWRAEATGLYRAPTPSTPREGITGEFRLWTLGLRGCGALTPRRLEIPLCAGLELGRAIGDASGPSLSKSERARLTWTAITLGPALAWAPRPWLALWAGVDLAVPLFDGRFAVAGLGELHDIAPVSLRGALGLEFRLGRR